MSGTFFGQDKILIKCIIGFDPKYGCVVKVNVKSTDEILARNLAESL